MTTKVYFSLIDNSTDAGFRAWSATLAANLALVGLVQTADTGQINFTTVTRPAINTAGGYQIWRFADSSLFLKIEYGSGSTQTFPMVWITVGTGSNGSGSVSGQTSTRATIAWGAAPASLTQNYYTVLCHTADAFSMLFGIDAVSGTTPMAALVIGKTVNTSGIATSIGYGVLRFAGSAYSMQSVRIAATAQTFNDTPLGFTQVPGIPISSLRADNLLQVFKSWVNVPDVQWFPWVVSLTTFDIPRLATFSVLSHTYITVPAAASVANMAASNASLAFIYE